MTDLHHRFSYKQFVEVLQDIELEKEKKQLRKLIKMKKRTFPCERWYWLGNDFDRLCALMERMKWAEYPEKAFRNRDDMRCQTYIKNDIIFSVICCKRELNQYHNMQITINPPEYELSTRKNHNDQTVLQRTPDLYTY